jgi:hypothetical protein
MATRDGELVESPAVESVRDERAPATQIVAQPFSTPTETGYRDDTTYWVGAMTEFTDLRRSPL